MSYLIKGTSEDHGDQCHRTFMYMIAKCWLNRVYFFTTRSVLKELREPNFPWRMRRTSEPGWFSEWNRFSRDQSIPVLVLFGELHRTKDIFKMLLPHVLRFGFFYNTRRNGSTYENHKTTYHNGAKIRNYAWKLPDIAGPSFLALYIRGLRLWPLYPLLLVFDIELVVNALLWRFARKGDTDVLNYVIMTRYAQRRMPTPWNWVIRWIEHPYRLKVKMFLYGKRVGYDLIAEWRELI